MADQFTPLEDKLDVLYATGRDELAQPGFVQSWDDYLQRRGYLAAIADCGQLIKEIRKPVSNADGEIPSILPDGEI